MKHDLTLTSSEFDRLLLRSIAEADQENLRRWKNANRLAFFYQEVISPEDQAKWFEGYLEREHDWMFVVDAMGEAIGCMGFRLMHSAADVYNVILGNPSMGGQGWMRNAMRLMCSYVVAEFTREIKVKVMRSNQALGWYRKIGFYEYATHDTFLDLKLDLTWFQSCKFQSSSRSE